MNDLLQKDVFAGTVLSTTSPAQVLVLIVLKPYCARSLQPSRLRLIIEASTLSLVLPEVACR